MIAALLTASVAVAQTTPQSKDGGSASASAKGGSGAGKPTATTKPSSTGSSKPNAASATEPSRPLPEHSLKTKLRNSNTTNPYYNLEKDKGERRAKREYTPRRTQSGARKDTMDQQKP